MATATPQQLHDYYGILQSQLDRAYQAAATDDDRDTIEGSEDAVFDILTELNRMDLSSRTAAFDALEGEVHAINQRLKKLKDDLDDMVHDLKIAADVAAALDKAIGAATSLFPTII